jgi:nucleoid DNA-binding protein
MDIDLLSKMVKELILEKDRVVLPGLGCFVAEMVPATFSDKGYTINPPYRKLSFRSRPDMGDELIDFYVDANGLDRDVACRILGDFIRELRQIIFSKKVVILPGLGRLRATKENNLFFIPDEDLDIYPAGMGLEPISLKSHVETPQEVASAISGLRSIMDEVISEKSIESAQTNTEVEPSAESVTELVSEPETPVEEHAQDTVQESSCNLQKQKSSKGKRIIMILCSLVAAAAMLLGAYVGLSRLNPEIFDSILYSSEELEILNYKK